MDNKKEDKRKRSQQILDDMLAPEVTELVAGYEEAKNRLSQILLNLRIGDLVSHENGEDHWLVRVDELELLLDSVKPDLLVGSNPPLIKVRKLNGDHHVDIDNTIYAMILDELIKEGNYKLNYLHGARSSHTFVGDNWHRVVDKLQWLIMDAPFGKDAPEIYAKNHLAAT